MSKRVMIAGYYGANNTGDEAILTGMIHALQQQGITEITVLSRNPEQTKKMHGVESLYIGRRFDGLGPIYKQLKKTDLFILGGGGLLQDYTRRVVPYWLSRVLLALASRTPIMYYAQGLGPLNTTLGIQLVRLISNRVNWITVRDEASMQLFQRIGVQKPPIEVTADPALGIKVTSDGKELLRQEGIPLDNHKIKVGISLRPWKDKQAYLPVLIRSLQRLQEAHNVQFVFFPFQYGEDEKISREVMQAVEAVQAKEDTQTNQVESYLVQGKYTPEQIAAMLKEMDGVIAMRLHAIILSAISSIPSFGLVYDPKVLRFMDRASLGTHQMEIEQMEENEEDFYIGLNEWLLKLDELSLQMKESVEEMIEKSMRNAEVAKNIK
jgi:polysaccharide pyruvyl transferase CsaB